uniref:Uncharacterized protein n=1 Tax=Glossina palpalis gambiensis TaxID=67801 RepID=A0A1B0C250_9MUSC
MHPDVKAKIEQQSEIEVIVIDLFDLFHTESLFEKPKRPYTFDKSGILVIGMVAIFIHSLAGVSRRRVDCEELKANRRLNSIYLQQHPVITTALGDNYVIYVSEITP